MSTAEPGYIKKKEARNIGQKLKSSILVSFYIIFIGTTDILTVINSF